MENFNRRGEMNNSEHDAALSATPRAGHTTSRRTLLSLSSWFKAGEGG